MPCLAAFAPPHWSVIHIDEVVSPVDFGMLVDLVAITFHTPSAPHAYAMADQFRQRGTPVVLGGPHAGGSQSDTLRILLCEILRDC
jgi:hypothetical protein